ncbi:MAG: right-handed parallel beta-helix repeat-containing protein [Kiritimatiellae bacterium]|nr:right-handed parallel beta-helix repeat-containing protein [Kiritimatiellia bacterium]
MGSRIVFLAAAIAAAAGLAIVAPSEATGGEAEDTSFLAARRSVRVSDFGYDPEDSTRFLQAALDSGSPTVVLDRQSGPWVTLPLVARSNTTIIFEPGVELQAKRGAFRGVRDYLFFLNGVTNVVILGSCGARMKMHKADYQKPPYLRSEWRFALRIDASTNVTVQGMAFVESGGDGIVVTGNSKDVTIRDCLCDGNHRQGISIIAAENVLIEKCVLRNTSGTAPAAGIDLEPDQPWEKLKNIVIRDCLSENNDGDGYQSYLSHMGGESADISVTFERCRSVGNNRGFWFDLAAGRNFTTVPRGYFRFIDCAFEDSKSYGLCILGKPAQSIDFIFENCTFANCATDRSSSPIRIGSSYGYQQPPTDDIRFDNLVVRTDDGRKWIECDRSSLSTQRVANITGNARIIRNGSGREERVIFDEAFAAEHLAPRFTGELPDRANVTDNDWNGAVICDSEPGRDATLTRIWCHEGVRYVFHAPESGTLAFAGRTRPSKAREPEFYNAAYLKGTVFVRPISGGDPIRCDAPGPDGGPITVAVPAPGFYTMSFQRRGTDFALEASPVPIAVDTRERFVQLTFDGDAVATFWLDGTASDMVALVRGGTYSGSRADVNLSPADADGRAAHGEAVRCLADGDWHPLRPVASSRLLRLSFSPVPSKPYTFFALDMLGAPGLFFLSAEKTWNLKNEQGHL